MTLNDHIQRYLRLVQTTDALFEKVRSSHATLMPCKPGCDDCCSVYFQLSLIEAFVINGYFRNDLSAKSQQEIIGKSVDIEPMFEQALRKSSSQNRNEHHAAGESPEKMLGTLRIPCVLHSDGSCLLYVHRPITCRLYGTPQNIGGQVIACPKTGFQKSHAYLSINIMRINEMLYEYSREFMIDLIGISPVEFTPPLFALPTALRLNFDKSFFMALRETLEA